jgi:uncharacterized protein (TIGR02246 family)
MKTICVIICISLLFVCGCAQKSNAPADVEAVKASVDAYFKAMNAHDIDAVTALMTDKTIYNDLNTPPLAGKDAIKKMHQNLFGQYNIEMSSSVPDVKVSGDLGTAHGTWTIKLTPKEEGLAKIADQGSYTIVLNRQSDGSWKWDSCMADSSQPMPGATADGAEEAALVKMEKDCMQALLKSDAAAFEQFMAKEWTMTEGGQTTTRAQMLADLKNKAFKIESLQLTDLNPHVFGETALVTSTLNWKGKYRGTDVRSPVRSIDFFMKRNGKWQAVSTENTTVK